MADIHVVVTVTPLQAVAKKSAKIALNGYNIGAGNNLGRGGAMRSFKVVDNSSVIWSYWEQQTLLVLRDAHGVESRARIFAVPADDESSGLVEFLS